jgi:polyisoprenoid-binding protein YceI
MDQQVQAVMEASRYPRITFRLGQLILRESTNSAALQFSSQGTLEMHGRKTQIDLPVSIAEQSVNRLKVRGSAAVRMSDFGILPPPVLLSGEPDLAEDEVAVSFEWIVQRSSTTPPALTERAR